MVYQFHNRSEFKSELTKLLEKHKVDVRRATKKFKHTHTTFVEVFNQELEKQLFKAMDVQELQDPEKVSANWIKNLNSIVNKVNKTKSLMYDMKPKDATKLNILELDQQISWRKTYQTYPEEKVLPGDGRYRYLYRPGEQTGDQNRQATDFIWSENTYRLNRIVEEPGNRILY